MSTKTAAPRAAAPKPELTPRAMAALAAHPVNAKLTKADKLCLYRDMVRIRRFEERCVPVYQKGKIGGFLHLYIGQEAVAMGTISLLGEHDHIITAYRDHGHALGVGMSMNECMAELTGKVTGCSKGKGGSMHFFAPDKRYWGGHGIVGGQIPLGTGIAYALKFKGLKGCCLSFMGDGAVNQGAVHEAYNLAALWNLPIVFIIENNKYSMGTSQERSSAGEPLAKRADGYDMAWDLCNGNILYEVREKTATAIKRAHEESKPTLLEIFTYRYRGHSVADPDKTYRTKQEISDYRENKDPITLFQKCLQFEGVLDEAAIVKIDEEASAEAEASAKFAEESPFPQPEAIMQDIYWEEDNRTEKSNVKGRMFFQGLE
ncbi:MAG TPA: pyruvate dehydrogenase (acetyl-transferring) E1 component subunit alpha [Opitutales bacterium]|nr:pyruvate dehydrogenase (acetyl-transferring) E1 component subunit alpha [Opitutales bacterium]